MFICFSRCHVCGIRTPHEVCHRHSRPNRLGHLDEAGIAASPDPEDERERRYQRSQYRAWKRWFDRPQEVCPPMCKGGEEGH